MRVGVYLAGLSSSYVGGLTTYAVGLLNGLIGNTRGSQIVTFVSDDARRALSERITIAANARYVTVKEPSRSVVEYLTRLPGLELFHEGVRNRRMRRIADQIASECDVVLFPLCFMATYRLDVPSIVSFHDLQHEAYPQFFSWRALRARRVQFGATFRHASVIQASSLAMKAEALKIYGDRLKPERIAVIPEGVEYEVFAAPTAQDARKIYGLPEEFLFYPAQLWQHKNHLRLLQAIELLASRNGVRIPLVLTGAEYEAAPAVRRFIAEHGMGEQAFVLGKVPFESLLSLYRQASYVVSASLHESNCLPLLEATASGTPIIAADIAANRETARVFKVRLFDPFDVESIAATLGGAWRDRLQNAEDIEANRNAARRLDWTVIADMYLDRAETLISPQRPGS
jgi:glycosyltransferase involved in cell wall biosynthesis